MNYTGYELLWLFFIYGFLGWVLETVVAAAKQKRFVNKGLINGPCCMLYGVGACVVSAFCYELRGIWLFAAATIISTVIEWIAGHIIEKLYHEKWWDYSKVKWNLDGYICLTMSLMWGALCTVTVTWIDPLLLTVFKMIPVLAVKMILWVLFGILFVDVAATLIVLSGRSKYVEQWETVDTWLTEISQTLGMKLYLRVNHRISKAYPEAQKREAEETRPDIFAYGCSFYKVFWLFMIGAFLGDITETIYCRIVGGVWMSRSSVVWGPFSLVWGIAMAVATILLYRYRNRSDRFLFIAGTFLGGAYEYICSVFLEMMFGKVFWDYSEFRFNLGGRINLLYCFFWGIAAVVWIKMLYPKMSDLIEKIPVKTGQIITWIVLAFMCCNMAVSAMALARSTQRSQGIEAEYRWQEIMDERFDDARMERIYPNAVNVSEE